MNPRILVIRGGAIGDFVLTLPALRLLRENFPAADVEILGYRHIVSLAEGRYYARATRSIEYAGLSRFFAPGTEREAELNAYFASFQQVISYLYDPDGVFDASLRQAGVRNLLHGPGKLDDSAHAAEQLARPLQSLALYLEDPAARLYPSNADFDAADEFLSGAARPIVAVHPGSGSERKNWPVERWAGLGSRIYSQLPGVTILLIGGEADERRIQELSSAWRDQRVRVARGLPLPVLAAVLSRCAAFVGNDSGISHIAAAIDRPCILLFGPTDPEIWAPRNTRAQILRAPTHKMRDIAVATVFDQLLPLIR